MLGTQEKSPAITAGLFVLEDIAQRLERFRAKWMPVRIAIKFTQIA
jgi:hypothetical protein